MRIKYVMQLLISFHSVISASAIQLASQQLLIGRAVCTNNNFRNNRSGVQHISLSKGSIVALSTHFPCIVNHFVQPYQCNHSLIYCPLLTISNERTKYLLYFPVIKK